MVSKPNFTSGLKASGVAIKPSRVTAACLRKLTAKLSLTRRLATIVKGEGLRQLLHIVQTL